MAAGPWTASPGTGAGGPGAGLTGSGLTGSGLAGSGLTEAGLAGAGLTGLARVDLVIAPTPLHPAPRLSRELGVPVLFKRDDLAGVGLGGNKLRGLEFLIADALAQGCDSLVTGAGPQSNWTMLAALACLRYGLEPHVVCYGTGAAHVAGHPEPAHPEPAARRGTCGCTAGSGWTCGSPGRRSGRRWMRASRRSRPGCARRAAARTWCPAAARRRWVRSGTSGPAWSWPPSWTRWMSRRPGCGWPPGPAGPRPGWSPGRPSPPRSYQVVGVTVSRPVAECSARVRELAAAAAALARPGPDLPGMSTGLPEPEVRGGWIGPGYGVPSAAGQEAARLVAATEGVFLDPVFGAKAMAALVADCRAGRVRGPQVFLVSGGAPTLFAGPAA